MHRPIGGTVSVTLTYDLDLGILNIYSHTKIEVFTSWLSKVKT